MHFFIYLMFPLCRQTFVCAKAFRGALSVFSRFWNLDRSRTMAPKTFNWSLSENDFRLTLPRQWKISETGTLNNNILHASLNLGPKRVLKVTFEITKNNSTLLWTRCETEKSFLNIIYIFGDSSLLYSDSELTLAGNSSSTAENQAHDLDWSFNL